METTNTLAIYGRSGHGKVVADIAAANGIQNILWIDDDPAVLDAIAFDVFLDKHAMLPVALGIGDNRARRSVFNKLYESGVEVMTLVHPTATLSASARVGAGSVVMPHAVINADTSIGVGAIINSSAVVEHDGKIGDFAHISPAAALAGNVTIGESAHVGIGSSVIQNVTVGEGSVIAAGSAVVTDIPAYVMAAGVPASPKKVLQR